MKVQDKLAINPYNTIRVALCTSVFFSMLLTPYLNLGAVDDKVLPVVGHLPVVHAVHGVVPFCTQRARPADNINIKERTERLDYIMD